MFADDRILYLKNAKYISRKLLELVNEYSKVTRIKINKQKSFAFLCSKNERSVIGINKTIIATKIKKKKKTKPKNKSTKGDKMLVCRKLLNTDERNQRQYKQMEKYNMFLD